MTTTKGRNANQGETVWKLLVDIVASALVGYFVEHTAEAVRNEAVALAHRHVGKVQHRPVHAVTYRQWVS